MPAEGRLVLLFEFVGEPFAEQLQIFNGISNTHPHEEIPMESLPGGSLLEILQCR